MKDQLMALGAVFLALTAAAAQAAPTSASTPDIAGVFRSVADGRVLPGGLRNRGNLSAIRGLSPPKDAPDAALIDPGRVCLPIGPFRMMAEPGSKIEIAPTPNDVVMLFEDVAHGFFRTIYLKRQHLPTPEPGFEGDSVGRFENGALVIDTIGLNDSTWLNAKGARHSDALRLRESVRSVLGGRFLEYKVTAIDPKALPSPFTYVRYYERIDDVISEDVCTIDDGAVTARPDAEHVYGGR